MLIFSFVSSFLTQSGNTTSCSSCSLPLLWRRLQDSIFWGREGAEVQVCIFRACNNWLAMLAKPVQPEGHLTTLFRHSTAESLKIRLETQLRWVSVGGQGKGGWFWSFLSPSSSSRCSLIFLKKNSCAVFHCMDPPCFFHRSLLHGHLGSFHSSAVINSTAMKIFTCTPTHIFTSTPDT